MPTGHQSEDEAGSRRRLGRLIDEQREALGKSQVEVAKHGVTYQKILAGDSSVSERTLRRAFRVIGWDPTSLPGVLAGGNPRPASPDSTPAPESDPRVAFEVGGMVASGWPAMTEQERQSVRDAAERAHRRLHREDDEDNAP
ncbi:hypothetical protein BBK14_11465 [Parafrankia soli]|uniref:Uncharacterized protein n=1 Tax=Parafrankia soli TaxID=2599596 RepID=A0A1S1R905_9ACTN|nr:hypothetical protein BBK14_11465 [Parafrankia soli]